MSSKLATAAISTASSGLSIKENADRIGVLLFAKAPSGLFILTEHVDQVDANEEVRRWKLPQDRLDKPSEHPGKDARALIRSHFGIAPREIGIWEVRMTPLRDSLPTTHTERKGFRNTLTTWVAVHYYGLPGSQTTTRGRCKWIHINNVLNECQLFKVANYAEVLKLLDEHRKGPPTH